ncbi:fatty acid--CoA ligase [Mycolicibacterium sp. 120266]|uniref:fatty acid--CoA ligase n=1 Tax=Mycolicibacterium sp. 120266 TaxID=3090601 RepID=UPI00299E943E|nr:fatty acid--CoA ligase [Mycolicibacterium sp. 120266]MDX1876143.1 fatty acid--CoA ligase [Mycolicibacterium sp. 120266]
MQDYPLTIGAITRHGTTIHTRCQVRTRQPDGTMRVATFAQLGHRTAQLANALRTAGAGTDTVVATFMWNNQEHVEAYCAVPAMGAVLHTLNIRLATEQLVYIANHAGDEIAIVDASLAEQFSEIAPHVPTLHTIIVTGDADLSALMRTEKRVVRYDDILDQESPAYDWPDIDEHSAAAMCYTSGTTGNPKGVVYSHRSTYLHTMAICAKGALEVGPGDAVLPIVPMFHANAWGLIYAALMAGADLVLPDRFLHAEPLVELIERERPTIAGAVPTVWNDIVHYLQERPDADISSLRLVGCGGSAVPVHLMRTLHEKYGIYLVQAWGMTETSPLATISKPASSSEDSQYWQRRASQGRPACGVELRIVDSDGVVVGHDGEAIGELQLRGPWITGGYFDSQADDSFDAGWLRTGDVGSIDADGYVTLTDRVKDVIKSGGEWISSVQLELAIASHPDVFEAAVIAVPDDRWQERPLAAVVLGQTADVTIAELQDYLRDKVARWWIPERWAFVDRLPRTSTGKYDKKCLREQHRQGLLTPVDLTGR